MLSKPDLFCLKRIGPLEDILIKNANKGYSQLRINKITRLENKISNNLFKSLLILSFNGSFLKLRTGTLSKKSILTLLRGKPLKSGITLKRIKFWSEKSTRSLISSVFVRAPV